MSMTRKQWTSQFFSPSAESRPRQKRDKAELRVMPRWEIIVDGQTFVRSAWTRSEARAMVKQVLGVKRLPSGCRVRMFAA